MLSCLMRDVSIAEYSDGRTPATLRVSTPPAPASASAAVDAVDAAEVVASAGWLLLLKNRDPPRLMPMHHRVHRVPHETRNRDGACSRV
jgi:hypothetical protein